MIRYTATGALLYEVAKLLEETEARIENNVRVEDTIGLLARVCKDLAFYSIHGDKSKREDAKVFIRNVKASLNK